MQDAQEDRLRMLCELVENEPDLEKLLELVHEINTIAEARLKRSSSADTEKKPGTLHDQGTP